MSSILPDHDRFIRAREGHAPGPNLFTVEQRASAKQPRGVKSPLIWAGGASGPPADRPAEDGPPCGWASCG